jgi:hypothetical protein
MFCDTPLAKSGGRCTWKQRDDGGLRGYRSLMLLSAVVVACSLAMLLDVAGAQTPPAPQPAIVQNVTGNSNTNIGVNNGQVTINGVDPAMLMAMTNTFTNEIAATATARAQAEARAAELAKELGFTSAAVAEFFRILGKEDVPAEKLPERLVEIAEHFAQTRDALAALEPDDPQIAAMVGSAAQVLQAGRLSEADRCWIRPRNLNLPRCVRRRNLKGGRRRRKTVIP